MGCIASRLEAAKARSANNPLWERACSRRRHDIHHQLKLTHRYREQARSHRGHAAPVWGLATRAS
ncbi:hypothetical protein FGE05_04695 [Pseudomonas sp. ICMP22404]|nr:hypothetical protein FGE05_04695 [Pseudomonas sp. ICMP22404]